jgi:hypothetical protein
MDIKVLEKMRKDYKNALNKHYENKFDKIFRGYAEGDMLVINKNNRGNVYRDILGVQKDEGDIFIDWFGKGALTFQAIFLKCGYRVTRGEGNDIIVNINRNREMISWDSITGESE